MGGYQTIFATVRRSRLHRDARRRWSEGKAAAVLRQRSAPRGALITGMSIGDRKEIIVRPKWQMNLSADSGLEVFLAETSLNFHGLSSRLTHTIKPFLAILKYY